MTSLSIKLEARSAVHRCFRAYQIDVDTDLFGVWLVEMSYGRIGGLGRSKIRSFTTIEGAQAQVHACLRKRATAPLTACAVVSDPVPAGPRGTSTRGHNRGRVDDMALNALLFQHSVNPTPSIAPPIRP